jgi:L-aspartate oxidase
LTKTDYEYIIIGSGIAGLNTALLAREHGSVLILTKGNIDDCNTRYAQGGIAAAIGPEDSPTLHGQDTLAAGAGLCDPEAVQVLTEEGPPRVARLIQQGIPFDTIHGQIDLATEGAHSMPRILHAGGDATGQHIELTFANLVGQSDITVMESTMVTRIIVEKGTVRAVESVDSNSGHARIFTARSVVLASGGAGQIYRYNTNTQVATGDGVVLGFQAGAEIMDMEFYQFHPTALRLKGAPPFLLSEAMRGEGAILRDASGQAFMGNYHPLGDLAPRDVVSRALAAEMEKPNNEQLFLDISHIPPNRVTSRFPTIYKFCISYGIDITQEPVPVAPAAHYMMGGVKSDIWGRTNIQGLYACGEVACSAVHGANRLASNSLLDTLVFPQRLVASSLGLAPAISQPENKSEDKRILQSRMPICANIPPLTLANLQDLMWRNVGIIRNGSRLILSARILYAWDKAMPIPSDRPTHELRNMVILSRLVVEAALLRQESRGSHFRQDFPNISLELEKHIVLVKNQDVK